MSSDEPLMAKTRGFTLCRGLRDSFLADIARVESGGLTDFASGPRDRDRAKSEREVMLVA